MKVSVLRVVALALLMGLAGMGELCSDELKTQSQPGDANDPGPAQTQLQRFGNELQSLHARFRQIVIGTDGQVLEQGEGELWLRKPNLFRWSLEGEFPELIVADGERLWLYDEALEQVTVRAQSGLAMDSPLLLLSDPTGLERQFRLAELGQIDGLALLELTPMASEAEFERVIIGLQDDLPVSMMLEDAFGLRTDMQFEDLQRNDPPDGALFRFDPPADVDVVGDLEGLGVGDSAVP